MKRARPVAPDDDDHHPMHDLEADGLHDMYQQQLLRYLDHASLAALAGASTALHKLCRPEQQRRRVRAVERFLVTFQFQVLRASWDELPPHRPLFEVGTRLTHASDSHAYQIVLPEAPPVTWKAPLLSVLVSSQCSTFLPPSSPGPTVPTRCESFVSLVPLPGQRRSRLALVVTYEPKVRATYVTMGKHAGLTLVVAVLDFTAGLVRSLRWPSRTLVRSFLDNVRCNAPTVLSLAPDTARVHGTAHALFAGHTRGWTGAPVPLGRTKDLPQSILRQVPTDFARWS